MEGRSPLAPRHPRGCRGAERPTPASPETKFFAGMPAPSEIQIPASTAPGESERVATLSLPVPRGDVGERSAPRPFRRKPNSPPEQSNLPRWKSKFPPAQPRESARGCEPSRTPSPAPSETSIPVKACPAIPPLHYTSRVEKTQAILTQIALIPARSTFVPRLIQRFPPFIHNPLCGKF